LERDLLPMCAEESIAVIPYNPLAGGVLTGKHDLTVTAPAGTRFAMPKAARRYHERYWDEQQFETVEALRPLAAEAGMSMATLAVSWVLSNPAVTAALIGASRPEQLADSLMAAEKGALPTDLNAKLDELSHAWRALDADR